MSRPTRRRLATWLGAAGGGVGILAGLIQTTAGSQIPEWSGAKADPRALGLLTILLSAVALLAALRQSRPGLTTGLRGVAALALLVPGLLCLTTVGRLWYLPGLLILSAGFLTVDSWTDTWSLIRQNWRRCLLGGLGVSQLLMAAGSTGIESAVGVVSGVALIAAAWWPKPRRSVLVGMLVLGTVPFAAFAWTALVPVLVMLVTAVVAMPFVRETGRAERLRHQSVRIPHDRMRKLAGQLS